MSVACVNTRVCQCELRSMRGLGPWWPSITHTISLCFFCHHHRFITEKALPVTVNFPPLGFFIIVIFFFTCINISAAT